MNGADAATSSARPRGDAAKRAQRILVVASELPPGPGGIGTHAHAVALELCRQGREVTLLGSQHYASIEERRLFNDASPVPITTFSDGSNPVSTARTRARELGEHLARFEPDVILASGGRVLWLAALAGRRHDIPVVGVAHGTELGGPAWQRHLTRIAFERCARIVAVSEFTADLVCRLGVQGPRIDVVHNGADAERFHPDATARVRFRERHGLDDRPVILTVGNVTERKGQHLVVEALPAIIAQVPDVAYVLAGTPTDATSLQQQARVLGVSDHLVVLGQVTPEEVTDAQSSADVFAMTSTTTGSGDVEGFGIAVVEAALCGVPAVVTRGTGAEEAVRHDVTGLAVPPEPQAIATALSSMLRDAERRGAMGAAAEHAARSTGSWSARAAAYGRFLDDAVARKPRIVVVSHTEHWTAADGTIMGFGATTRELDQLATLASELVHVAPLHDGDPPGMALAPAAPNIRFVPVRPAGGNRTIDRVLALRAVPGWATTINREVAEADIVHVRCPAGISMLALLVLWVRRRPRIRWVKYAGNWAPDQRDAATYRLQRWWLRKGLARAAVTANGRWPDQPPWVHSFDNPTLTATEIEAGRRAADAKPSGPPYRVVFAGRLEEPKGAHTAIDTVLELRQRGLDVSIDLIGDGPLRPWSEAKAAAADAGVIRLHGWTSRRELEGFLANGHAFLLPTTASEGFPKVVAEAMAFGCVPVTSTVSSMGQTLEETGGAMTVQPGASWAEAVARVLADDERSALRSTGLDAVERFSFPTYLHRVEQLIRSRG